MGSSKSIASSVEYKCNSCSNKKVSFADMSGGCLNTIHIIAESSNAPQIVPFDVIEVLQPGSYQKNNFNNSLIPSHNSYNSSNRNTNTSLKLELGFSQPFASANFLGYVREQGVLLENCYIRKGDLFSDNTWILIGIVRVLNIAYEKNVILRHTHNDWNTIEDTICSYVESLGCSNNNINRSVTDRFEFSTPLPITSVCNRWQFAIRYKTYNLEMWDNNNGKNYTINYLYI